MKGQTAGKKMTKKTPLAPGMLGNRPLRHSGVGSATRPNAQADWDKRQPRIKVMMSPRVTAYPIKLTE